MELDEPVDGFGAAVVGAAGGEVGEERVAPLSEGAAQAGDLGDRAAREVDEDSLRDGPARSGGGLVVDGPDLLGAMPGDLNGDVLAAGYERRVESGSLPVGEVFLAGAQDVADPVERIIPAAAVELPGPGGGGSRPVT